MSAHLLAARPIRRTEPRFAPAAEIEPLEAEPWEGEREVAVETLPAFRAASRHDGGDRLPQPPREASFTAGERLAVTSVLTSDEAVAPRRRGIHPILLGVLVFFAAIGAATVTHAVAGMVGWNGL